MVSNHMSYLKEAFREAARREFANVPPESELSYVFSSCFEKRILSILNNENNSEENTPECQSGSAEEVE